LPQKGRIVVDEQQPNGAHPSPLNKNAILKLRVHRYYPARYAQAVRRHHC
jgi:hypothetical protein